MESNLTNIILSTMNSINLNRNIDIRLLIKEYQNKINETFNILLEANKVDLKNDNGFIPNLNTINNIFNLVLNEKYSYGDTILSTRNEELNITYGKLISNIGTVCTIFDGNMYTLLEIILRNLLSNNSTIFSYSGYMYGTNTYLLELLKEILSKNNLDKNLVNQYITEDYKQLLSNYTSIDLVICIGPKELQNTIVELSKNKTIVSGYENYEIYIDSLDHISFLEHIMSQDYKITLYAKESLGILNEDIFIVSDEDEAISMINNTGSNYSTSVFTDNPAIASKFLQEIKSKQVLVNTSPTIEHFLDIKQSDLYTEKTIIYPVSNKIDGNSTQIKIEQ